MKHTVCNTCEQLLREAYNVKVVKYAGSSKCAKCGKGRVCYEVTLSSKDGKETEGR